MTLPRSSSTDPYELAVAHLKRGEYTEAVAAFTEAIVREPDAPNAYVGRALAYRSLGEESRALQDEQVARELGGPERTTWDRVVNRASRRWRGDLRDPDWRQTDPLSHQAVLLCLLNAQILNGGLYQWIGNGYGEWVDDVIKAAREVGTDASRAVAAVLEDVARHLQVAPGVVRWGLEEIAVPEDDLGWLWLCEQRYHEVQSQFVQDVEEWLETRAGLRR